MRITIAVVGVVAIGLLAAGALGVAGAETTPTPTVSAPVRTVSVQGVAEASVEPTATTAAATAVYRQAMAAAVVDGQSKAQFLAEKTGATLGSVQSVSEGGGYIDCPGEEEYQGGQPDFGSGSSPVFAAAGAPVAESRTTPSVHKVHHTKRRPHKRRPATAKKSAVEPCALSTQVALVYQLD
jgi:hypothetical protein